MWLFLSFWVLWLSMGLPKMCLRACLGFVCLFARISLCLAQRIAFTSVQLSKSWHVWPSWVWQWNSLFLCVYNYIHGQFSIHYFFPHHLCCSFLLELLCSLYCSFDHRKLHLSVAPLSCIVQCTLQQLHIVFLIKFVTEKQPIWSQVS